MIYADFESTLVPEDNGMQNQRVLKLTNIKNMLLVVMDINQYVLISLVSLLKHTQAKMQFTIVLLV